jgi:pyruvate/2-oxoglutarate dehydrogenase complex dihydrolipoamide acyltransferase (E2) component
MALAMQEMVRIKGEPHAAAAPGTLHAWKVQKGQVVEAGEVLAIVRSATSGHYQLLASCAGIVRAILAPVGKKLTPSEVVCYVEPQDAPESRQASDATPRPRQGQNASQRPNGVASDAITRRPSTQPAVEELSVPSTPAASSTKPQRGRTTHKTYHLSEEQTRRIKRLSLELRLDDNAPDCNESELVRAAVEMLLSLPQPALLQWVEENRRREAAGRYGTGFPRPGKRPRGAK